MDAFITLVIAAAIVFYLLGFFLLAFLRRWRWLLPLAGAGLVFCGWGFLVVPNESFAVLLPYAALSFLACGLVAGFIVGAGTLLSRRLRHRGPLAVFGVAVFVFVPILFCGTYYGWDRFKETRRAPTLACASRLHLATLGDMRLALPSAPTLEISTNETPPRFWFNNPEEITRFCGLTTEPPPALASVALLNRATPYRYNWFCSDRRDYVWWDAVCAPFALRLRAPFPETMQVFLAQGRGSTEYRKSRDELRRIRAGDRALVSAADGFRRYGRDQQSFSYVRDDDSSYIAECEGGALTRSAYMTCRVAREVSPDIGLTYPFQAEDDSFAGRAQLFDRSAGGFIASLKAP